MSVVTLDQARAAKNKAAALFAALPELQGIGIALLDGGGFGVKINLSCKPEGTPLPDEIDGVPVVIDIIGPVGALTRDRPC